MMVIPLSILKWLLLIAGIYGLASKELNPVVSVILIIVGGVWILSSLSKRKNKKSDTTSSAQQSNNAPTPPASTPAPKMFCPNCGARLVDNAPFCQNCGRKMN